MKKPSKETIPPTRIRVSLSLKESEYAVLKAASGRQHPTTFAKWAALLLAERVTSTALSQQE